MPVSSDDFFQIKSLILSKRKLMVGLGSQSHWLKIHEGLRSILEMAFAKITREQMANIMGFSADVIAKWDTERQVVSELKVRVDLCQSMPGKRISPFLKPDLCLLANAASTLAVAKTFGVSRASLSRWQNEGWDKVDSPEPEHSVSNVPRRPEEDVADPLDASPEVKQLELYLERHKGKLRKKYSPSEKKLMLALAERYGSKSVHDHFGVSYDTIARLKRRQENEVERKKRIPMRYIPVMEIMRKHPGMGPMQIRDYIRRHLGLSMGVNSIRKVMEQQGWVPPFVKTTHIKDGLQFYEAARKNYLFHMDFKHQWINKCKVFILFIQDDYSRFIVGHATADGEKVDDVIVCVEESIRIHGKPESIMTDGGSAFFSWRGSSRFTRFLEDYGIEQMIASTPNVNGKLENLNAQVEKELLTTTTFASVDHFNRELSKWVGFYNFSRVHQGLNKNQVPADRYYPGAKQWIGEASEVTRQQSLIAETMATLLVELKKPK